MLSVRATLKAGALTLKDKAGISLKKEYDVILTFLDKDVTLIDEYTARDMRRLAGAAKFNLTDYEIGILHLPRDGLTNDEIASQLEIAIGTLRNQLSGIYRRLGVSNRTAAVTKLNEYGILG